MFTVALLFPVAESLVPTAGVIVTVLVTVDAGVVAGTVATIVRVTEPPGATVIGRSIAFVGALPFAALHDEPAGAAAAAQVQVTPVSGEGTLSVILAAVAVDGPALLTVIV